MNTPTALEPRRKASNERIIEIEGLRAIAVIAVIVNHFFESALPSGFLGVDIFFVVSGFVITKYLRETTFESWGHFLASFYARRMKRLFPALWSCVLITGVLFAWIAIHPSSDIFRTGGYSLIGFSNNYLFKIASDYFAIDSKLNPFTHTWSLGIEEQFYALFPILLGALNLVKINERETEPSARKLAFLVFGFTLSFCAWILWGFVSKTAQFYLLPFRLWEFGVGCCCFLVKEKNPLGSSVKPVVALLSLISILFLPETLQLVSTFLTVILTATLLYGIGDNGGIQRILKNELLVFVGSTSYSLYLWHWPVLVLGRWTVGTSSLAKAACLPMVLIFAGLSYYLIERPIRRIETRKNTIILLITLVVAVLSSIAMKLALPRLSDKMNTSAPRVFSAAEVPAWPELECHGKAATDKFPDPLQHCLGGERTGRKPHIIYLLGDSHAAQLYWMVESAVRDSPYQLKFINLEDDMPHSLFLNEPNKYRTLAFVSANAKPHDIVIISFHRGLLNNDRDKHIPLEQSVPMNDLEENFVKNISPFIKEFKGSGVVVLLLRDTPLMRVVSNSPSCVIQSKLFGENICSVTKAQDRHTRSRQDRSYDKLRKDFENVLIWDPSTALFHNRTSFDVVDSERRYLMQDWNHITQYQSELLSRPFSDFLRKEIF